MVERVKILAFVFFTLISATACTISTDYPYNPGSVVPYCCPETIAPIPIEIPPRPYYEYDHPNQNYYHTTPLKMD
jgi:hypothetical protein